MTVGEALEVLSREVEVLAAPLQTIRPAYRQSTVVLPNGWHISVGFGFSHHCSNYGPPDPAIVLENGRDCEIALFEPGGPWFLPHGCDGDHDGRCVWERVPADLLLPLVDAVATYREGAPCPCPDCVRERVGP